MHKECPICGRPFSILDVVLMERDAGFQCHHCWNRIHATGPATPAAPARRPVPRSRRITASKRKRIVFSK